MRAAIIAASLVPSFVFASTISAGNLFVYRVGTGTGALGSAAAAVFIDEYTTGGALVQSIPMPTAASGANGILTASGSATSDGLLTPSTNGQYLMVTGYDAAPGTASVVTGASARTVGRVALNGTVDTTTRLSDAGSSNFRSAASTDGVNIWVSGGATGVRYTTLGATTSTQLSNTVTASRAIGIAGRQLYITTTGTGVRLGSVGSGLPTTAGQTIANLAGFPSSGGSPYGFFFADLSASVAGLDTLYVADDSLGLQKYSLVGTNWTLNGTVGAAADAFRGLTGVESGGVVSLYAVGAGSKLVSLTDSNGYNSSFSSLLPTTLTTAGTNTAFRGVALLYAPVPEPATWALWCAGLVAFGALRRKGGTRPRVH
jgi:hypothetical protein